MTAMGEVAIPVDLPASNSCCFPPPASRRNVAYDYGSIGNCSPVQYSHIFTRESYAKFQADFNAAASQEHSTMDSTTQCCVSYSDPVYLILYCASLPCCVGTWCCYWDKFKNSHSELANRIREKATLPLLEDLKKKFGDRVDIQLHADALSLCCSDEKVVTINEVRIMYNLAEPAAANQEIQQQQQQQQQQQVNPPPPAAVTPPPVSVGVVVGGDVQKPPFQNFCSNCGAALTGSGKFCSGCGQKVN